MQTAPIAKAKGTPLNLASPSCPLSVGGQGNTAENELKGGMASLYPG